jgi:hypothetical protein
MRNPHQTSRNRYRYPLKGTRRDAMIPYSDMIHWPPDRCGQDGPPEGEGALPGPEVKDMPA